MSGSLQRLLILLATAAGLVGVVYWRAVWAWWASLGGLEQTMAFAIGIAVPLVVLMHVAFRSGAGRKQP